MEINLVKNKKRENFYEMENDELLNVTYSKSNKAFKFAIDSPLNPIQLKNNINEEINEIKLFKRKIENPFNVKFKSTPSPIFQLPKDETPQNYQTTDNNLFKLVTGNTFNFKFEHPKIPSKQESNEVGKDVMVEKIDVITKSEMFEYFPIPINILLNFEEEKDKNTILNVMLKIHFN